MNPMLQHLNSTSNLANRIQQMKRMMSGNPAAMLQNAIAQNPQLAAIIRESGGDYRQAFYNYAQKLGVDGDEIMRMIRN